MFKKNKKNQIKNFFSNSVAIIFGLLILIEIITLKFPSFGRLGMCLWLLSWFCLIVFTIKTLWQDLAIKTLHKKIIFTPVIVVFLLANLLFNILTFPGLSKESTQEIGQTINHITKSLDAGFKQTTFLGYPTRQFYLPSLFSLAKRALPLLRFGNSLYYILGIIIFSSGFLRFYKFNRTGDLLCSILLILPFHSHHLNFLYFYLEQAFYPFGLGMIAVGLLLHYLSKPEKHVLLLMALVNLFLISSYTTTLAIFCLAITVEIGLLFSRKVSQEQKKYIICIVIFSLLSFILSFFYRQDIRILDNRSPATPDLLKQLTRAFQLVIFSQDKAFISSLANLPFLFILLYSLFSGWQSALVVFWVISVFLFSVASYGYGFYDVHYRLYRLTIIFPVIFALFAIKLKNLLKTDNKGIFLPLFLMLLIFFMTGYHHHTSYRKSQPVSQDYLLIKFMRDNQKLKKELNNVKKAYFVGHYRQDFISIYDAFQYFFPNLKTINTYDLPPNCLFTPKGLLFISSDNDCYAHFQQKSSKQLTAYSYQQAGDKKLLIILNQ